MFRFSTFIPAKTVIITLACFWLAAICNAETIFMKDGSSYPNVQDLKELKDLFIFHMGEETRSIPKHRVERIVDDAGRVIYEQEVLTAKKVIVTGGPTEFIFLRNGEEVGRCYWGNDGMFVVRSGRIPDGLYRQFYDSGKIERIFPFENGRLNGTSKVYFESGQLQREGTFRNGREEGLSKLFYKSGAIKGESMFENGEKTGETRLYYESGALKAVMNFDRGMADGAQQMYYESGTVEVEMRFRDGKRHGPIKQYYENGKLKLEGNYDNGNLDGLVTTYYESGRVKKTKNFSDGRILRDDSGA